MIALNLRDKPEKKEVNTFLLTSELIVETKGGKKDVKKEGKKEWNNRTSLSE